MVGAQKKTNLQLRVERLINKAEKMNYSFSNVELSVFKALGDVEWDEEKANYIALRQFEFMYKRLFSKRVKG